ncbi:hypothetical protein HPP92_002109 [Vanilla planifolia]|uniref:Uncharacterized protein n=1 Tax=Vanilla planifolia TaxID=51239 RepID=A0A835S4T9_VANPL|nr:hypothetical protein HPP92_002109 [Vanilla planifolia]
MTPVVDEAVGWKTWTSRPKQSAQGCNEATEIAASVHHGEDGHRWRTDGESHEVFGIVGGDGGVDGGRGDATEAVAAGECYAGVGREAVDEVGRIVGEERSAVDELNRKGGGGGMTPDEEEEYEMRRLANIAENGEGSTFPW